MPDLERPSTAPGAAAAVYRWRFGSAEFDAARNELRVGGLVVELQPKPLRMLALLLATPGETVTKERLLSEVWEDRVPGDAVLANAASKLRAALGPGNAQCIATVARQGYRFDGPLERLALGRRQVHDDVTLVPGAPVPGRSAYLLERPLGMPASGNTWLARQPRSGHRRVYKFALDGERLANLKREATLFRVLSESLGEHAAMVRVLDWNFESPPFWLECEPAGRSLLEWAEEPSASGTPRLPAATPEVRLSLFLQIADAVAAAHGVGVLHKDLKPANVLIQDGADGSPRVCLTDFGSGHLLEPERLDELRITRLGMTVSGADASSGTPLYIAPELLRGEPATARADVYSLGVMLFQLLTGDLRRPLAPGWEREVTDVELAADIAAATDLEPAHRLGSAAELAQRLRAVPQRAAERQAQAVREAQAAQARQALERTRARRPWVWAAGVALAGGAVLSVALYAHERQTAAELARQVEVSQALNRVLRDDLIGAANPGKSGRADITVAEALISVAGRVDERFGKLSPQVRGSVHAALQQALGELSRSREAVAAGRRAVAALSEASAADRAELQEARLRLALDLVQLSELDEARQVVTLIESQSESERSAVFRARLLFVKSWLTSGDLSLKESLVQLEEAWQLVEARSGEDVPGREPIAFALADNLSMLGRLGEAEILYRRLLAEQLQRHGPRHARALYTQVGLGRTLALQGKNDEARELLQRAADGLAATLGATHRQTLTARDQLAEIRLKMGDAAGAAAEWAVVHDGFAQLLGEGSSYTLSVRTNLATALHRSGRLAEAETNLRRVLELARAIPLSDDAPQVQQIRFVLASVLLDRGIRSEAAQLLGSLQPEALNLAQQEPDWPQRLAQARTRAGR